MSSFNTSSSYWDELFKNAKTAEENPLIVGGTAEKNSWELLFEALRKSLADQSAEEENKAAMQETAKANEESAKKEDETALSDALSLYEKIMALGDKQNARYDDLIETIKEGNYRTSPVSQEIINAYTEKGRQASGHKLADGAAENGGNPDTYAASQAAKAVLSFTEAGEEAARNYYGEQLDRLLDAIDASGKGVGSILSEGQKNVDARRESAADALSLAADLREALLSTGEKEREYSAETLSSLLKNASEKELYAQSVSPMEIDKMYTEMTKKNASGKAGFTPVEALMKLWEQYPGMREYILQKYQEYLDPAYTYQK